MFGHLRIFHPLLILHGVPAASILKLKLWKRIMEMRMVTSFRKNSENNAEVFRYVYEEVCKLSMYQVMIPHDLPMIKVICVFKSYKTNPGQS